VAIVKIEGIVVGETLYSESSKILKVFTPKYGIISVMSKGCRKPKSIFREASNKLIYANFDISYKERGISNLVGVEIIKLFKNIIMDYRDLEKKMYAFSLIDLTFQVLNQHNNIDNNEEIYSIFLQSLIKIDEGLNPSIITDIVKLKYLSYLGVKPSLKSCSNCGSTTNIVTLSSVNYGFVCSNCYTNEKIVSGDTLKMIRMLECVDISRIKKLDIGEIERKEINEFLEEYYENNTGIYFSMDKKIKALSKIETVL